MNKRYGEAHVVNKTVSHDLTGMYIAKDYTDSDNYFNNRLHCHNFWELNFIISGGGVYTINNEIVNIERGMVFLMTPADFHSCSLKKGESFVSYCIQFYPSQIDEGVAALLYSCPEPIVYRVDESRVDEIAESLEKLTDAFGKKDKFYELFARNSIENICIQIAQTVSRLHGVIDDAPIIRNAIVFVKDHYREKITLHDAAANARLSDAYFSHVFAQVMGTGFAVYLKNVRLNAACELLGSTEMSVKEICFSCGFNDPNYFSDSFRKRFGTSPRKYREQFKKDSAEEPK